MNVYEYVMVLQYALSIVFGLFIGFYILVPGTIKKIIWARITRQRVALGFISNDSGYTYLDMLRQVEDKGHKLGLFVGDKAGYIVTPRPTSDIKTREVVVEKEVVNESGEKEVVEEVVSEEYFEVDLDDKHAIDEAIQKKHIMDIGGIPVYFGYIGKSFACSPTLLAAMEQYDKNIEKKQLMTMTLLDHRSIKKYVPWTINPNIIDAIEWKAEQVGYLGRPPSETLKKMALPMGIILVICALAYFALKNGYLG